MAKLFLIEAPDEGYLLTPYEPGISDGGSMRQYSRWLSALLLLLAAVPAWTQDHMPKLIDVRTHYDGEPGILEKLLDKLDAAPTCNRASA
jgi:hypothetical protein